MLQLLTSLLSKQGQQNPINMPPSSPFDHMMFPGPPQSFSSHVQPTGFLNSILKGGNVANSRFPQMPSGLTGQTGTFPQNFSPFFNQMASQGLSSSVPSGLGVTSRLDQIKSIINLVEKSAPVIKQYGPMVKNVPTMFRLLKEMNNLEDQEDSSEEPNINDVITNTTQNSNQNSEEFLTDENSRYRNNEDQDNNPPLPKLYI
ncbi:VrrA/YqfQ family protein [Piscibacillus halophilus]|uniref:YqfQ-like protein n=1 Tax=Piscibacillus halophilus TaxID=571933 RepID=A0A1H9LEY6_9BACI|nr:VrrA/YqfQ family protein [Piscibacillus halophilus]SER09757.1 YqfQ-like protein [Piscibacillus halophilus]